MRGQSFVLSILYLPLNWSIFKWPLNVTIIELRALQLRRTLVTLLVTMITVPYSKETLKYFIKHFMALNQHDNMGIQKWSQNKPMNLFSRLLQDPPIVSIKATNFVSLDGHWHTSKHPPCPHFTPIPSLAQTLVPFGLLFIIKSIVFRISYFLSVFARSSDWKAYWFSSGQLNMNTISRAYLLSKINFCVLFIIKSVVVALDVFLNNQLFCLYW